MGNSAFSGGGGGGGGGGSRPWKDIKADFGAKGDGVTDDTTAFMNFNAYGLTQTGTVWLVLPPGSYNISLAVGAHFPIGIKKLIIDGYGASLNNFFLGAGFDSTNGPNKSALVQTVASGSATVTLVNVSDASKFTVGQYACITAYDLQGRGSFPPNPFFFEYRIVTAIDSVGGVITLDRELLNGYLSTYPAYDIGQVGVAISQGGPATLYAMQSTWDQELIVRGVSFIKTASSIDGGCKSLLYQDCSFIAPPAPSEGRNIKFQNCSFDYTSGVQLEVDKAISLLEFDNVTQRILQSPSASVEKQVVRNCRIRNLQGLSKHHVLQNTDIYQLIMGGTQFGPSLSLVMQNCRIQLFQIPNINFFMPAATLTNGRFVWHKYREKSTFNGFTWTSGTFGTDALFRNVVVGGTYFLAGASPFVVTAVTDNGVLDQTVTDAVLNSDTSFSSATANFTSNDVGIYIDAATGITSGTFISAFISSTSVTLNQATTVTGSGKTVNIRRNLIQWDTTLPSTINVPQTTSTGYAGIVNGTSGWIVTPHPCVSVVASGNVGPQDVMNMNNQPDNQPFGQYSRYFLQGSTGTSPKSLITGNLVKLTINVKRAYTGVLGTLTLGALGSAGATTLPNENGSPQTNYNPTINLKIAGIRVITPGSTTGTQSGDSNMTTTGVWFNQGMANGIGPVMSASIAGENQSTWPIIDVELITDQGISNKAAIYSGSTNLNY